MSAAIDRVWHLLKTHVYIQAPAGQGLSVEISASGAELVTSSSLPEGRGGGGGGRHIPVDDGAGAKSNQIPFRTET